VGEKDCLMPRIVCDRHDCEFNGLYQTHSALDGCCLTTSVALAVQQDSSGNAPMDCKTYQPRRKAMVYGYRKIDCVAKDGCKVSLETIEGGCDEVDPDEGDS